MMTTTEILNEIQRLPVNQQLELKNKILKETEINEEQQPKNTEEEFLQHLLAKGVISEIPVGMTDEEDDFEPVEFEGEPVSETIIRERR
jgi:hypothetical protein